MRKKLLRLLWVAPVAMLLFADAASAQSSGTIVGVVNDAATGKPVAGVLVIATSKALQGEQTAVTDARGQFNITALPPGDYKLSAQLQGFKPTERTDIRLRVDFTLRANLAIVPESVQMEEQVVRTGVAPAVNIGSAEAGTIVSRDFLASVPLSSRSFENAALVAPTATRDPLGISFAGASSPENNYIIDGLRVSDPSYGTLGTNLLTNFVDQLDIKVGSFMPEYGYSMAGVVNTLTKSGGNEFHGSIWGNLTPGFFSPATPATGPNGYATASQRAPYKGAYDSDFGVELGGPIVKDKLWFYAGFAPQMNYMTYQGFYRSRIPCTYPAPNCTGTAASPNGWVRDQTGTYQMNPIAGTAQTFGNGYTRYFGLAKLTWLINENNNVFVSFNTQPTQTFGRTSFNVDASVASQNTNVNTTNATVNYTGKFLEKHLLLNVSGGWFNGNETQNAQTINGVVDTKTPTVSWRTIQPISNFVPGITCPTGGQCDAQNYATGGWGFVENPTTNRYAGTASLTALFDLLGQHQLKGGAQIDYSTYSNSRYYSGGGIFYGFGLANYTGTSTSRYFNIQRGYGEKFGAVIPNSGGRTESFCADIDANGNCINEGLQDPANPRTLVTDTETWSNGFFLQDSWTIANVLTLNFGVRLDMQTMKASGAGVSDEAPTLDLKDQWAPRVQAIWDFTGTGRGKIQANWGMYYEAIPLDMGLRAFSSEPSLAGRFLAGTCRNKIGADGLVVPGFSPFRDCPDSFGNAIDSGPGPNITDLTGTPVKGFNASSGGGFSPVAPDLKGSYTQQYGGGIQYEVLQDLTLGVDYIGRAIGTVIEDMSNDDGNNYTIANPTVSKPWTSSSGSIINPSYGIGTDYNTGAAYSIPVAKPTRNYDAVSVTLNKLFSKKWQALASYTWSSSRGNYPGLLRWENVQLDPNITSEYDLIGVQGNKSGPLNGNRTHQIKAAGSYAASLSSDVTFVPSANIQIFSGTPVSAIAAWPFYGNTEVFVLPRGSVGNLDWQWQVDLGAKLLWAISGPYTLQFSLDIFNILNMTTVQSVDQIYTFDFTTPMQAAQCANRTSYSSSGNVPKTLAENCPDLPYARTFQYGRRVSPNPNFGQPQTVALSAYQLPISARFGVALSF